jgi:DNA-binding response OmpR family regulator
MRPRVLVVEDRPYVRDLVVAVLTENGYEARGLATAADALADVARHPPALIVLDMELPGMSGGEFLVRLRETALGAELPVLIISAHGDTEPPTPERRVLATLAKPFDYETLLDFVGRLLAAAPSGSRSA